MKILIILIAVGLLAYFAPIGYKLLSESTSKEEVVESPAVVVAAPAPEPEKPKPAPEVAAPVVEEPVVVAEVKPAEPETRIRFVTRRVRQVTDQGVFAIPENAMVEIIETLPSGEVKVSYKSPASTLTVNVPADALSLTPTNAGAELQVAAGAPVKAETNVMPVSQTTNDVSGSEFISYDQYRSLVNMNASELYRYQSKIDNLSNDLRHEEYQLQLKKWDNKITGAGADNRIKELQKQITAARQYLTTLEAQKKVEQAEYLKRVRN